MLCSITRVGSALIVDPAWIIHPVFRGSSVRLFSCTRVGSALPAVFRGSSILRSIPSFLVHVMDPPFGGLVIRGNKKIFILILLLVQIRSAQSVLMVDVG